MPTEFVFTVHPGAALTAEPISLEEAGLRERDDLQEWVRLNPHILGPSVRIVTFEFGRWQARDGQAADRLDLLGLDPDGRLVVAELKRGAAPDPVEMQAIKYAAFASRFTPGTLAQNHAAYLSESGETAVTPDAALEMLEEHAGGELDPDILRQPRIALVAASFPPQVTASTVWLTEMGIDISLIEFKAYRTEHDIVLTVSQTWPVPDVENFTVAPRPLELRAAADRARSGRDTRRFDLTIGTDEYPRLPKRRLAYVVVRELVTRLNVSPTDIASRLSGSGRRRGSPWLIHDGLLDGQEFAVKSREQGVDPGRYYAEDEELIRFDEQTYAFSNQWGRETEGVVSDLIEAYPRLDAHYLVAGG